MIERGNYMIKIEKVILKEIEVVESEDGEFVLVVREERTVPCFLTNFSLKRGKELDLLDGSLIADVMKLNALTKVKNIDEADAEAFNGLDETKMLAVVYLGCLGANPKFNLSLDEFATQFHEDYESLIELYTNLVTGLMQRDPNQFAKGLQKSTKKAKKKLKPQ
jgi:hypothetical protein